MKVLNVHPVIIILLSLTFLMSANIVSNDYETETDEVDEVEISLSLTNDPPTPCQAGSSNGCVNKPDQNNGRCVNDDLGCYFCMSSTFTKDCVQGEYPP